MACVLADSAIDFLRLLAIGYDEICWGEQFSGPPNTDPSLGFAVSPNDEFRQWVCSTFGVDIPHKGSDIVSHPDDMGTPGSLDPFNQWVQANTG